MSEADKPKIVVDSDWKSQARAEKERLAAAEKTKAPASGADKAQGGPAPRAGAAGGGGTPGHEQMPDADFSALVGTLITQALMYMGGFPDPETGRAVVSLEHAKFHIDLLGVLEAKTKGNLDEQEAADIKQALNELRLRFVEISKAVTQWQAQQALGATGGAGGMGGGMMGGGGDPLSFSDALRQQP